MCGMRDELKREMGRCQQLFNAVAMTVVDTNEWEDATVESDAARHCFRDMVNDYIIFARQMATDKLPGDPLRFAASSLRRLRRQWYAMRFFDLENYQEGFPSLSDIVHAHGRHSGNNQHPHFCTPTRQNCVNQKCVLSPQLPNGQSPPNSPIILRDSIDQWMSQIHSDYSSRVNIHDDTLDNLVDAETLAKTVKSSVMNGAATREEAEKGGGGREEEEGMQEEEMAMNLQRQQREEWRLEQEQQQQRWQPEQCQEQRREQQSQHMQPVRRQPQLQHGQSQQSELLQQQQQQEQLQRQQQAAAYKKQQQEQISQQQQAAEQQRLRQEQLHQQQEQLLQQRQLQEQSRQQQRIQVQQQEAEEQQQQQEQERTRIQHQQRLLQQHLQQQNSVIAPVITAHPLTANYEPLNSGYINVDVGQQPQPKDSDAESDASMITANDEAEKTAGREDDQGVADEANERRTHPQLAPSAALGTAHPEADRQLHRLQQNAAQLMEENAAQQLQIRQKDSELRAVYMEIQDLRRRQQTNHPARQTARQPEVVNLQPQSDAIEAFLKRASYDNLMRAREVGLRTMERDRPNKPLQNLSSTDYMMWKRKFKDSAKHDGLTRMDILSELPKWFSGPAKEIVETAMIGVTEESAEEELNVAFKKMDLLFVANRSNIPDLFNKIVAKPRIQSADHDGHFHLASVLLKAKKIAHTCGELYHCYRNELLQQIINNRVPHLADKFWEKHHESFVKGISFSFDHLVDMIETWAIIQRSKGVERESAAVVVAAACGNKTRASLTECCNVCNDNHATEECHQLLVLDVDDRVQKLASRRLCFHCLNVGHSAKGCANRPTCQICNKQHATILHGRTYPKKSDDEEVKEGGDDVTNGDKDL